VLPTLHFEVASLKEARKKLRAANKLLSEGFELGAERGVVP